MRKFFILFFLLSLFGYTSYSQTTFEKDSLRYTLNTDGTATVSSCLYLSTSEITIPQTVNDGTQDYTVKKIGDSAFYGKSFVTSVTFPSTLTTFGRYSFSRTGLTSVVIPEGVTTLTFELFSYCDQLTSVTIPEGVTTMERGVFYEDDLLNGVVLPSTLTTIGYHAFGRCIGLTAITIPANVSIIDEYAFQYCSNLETVDLKPQTMTTIGRNAFDSCEKLTAFHVPEGITTLGQDVFYGCKAMQELSLPSTLTSIGYRTFYNCISLPSVTIPEGVTTIGNEAFHYCKLLGGDITLPAGLTSLGSYAFAGCENVESVTFLGNNDVTMPGESQFSSMKKLKSVKLPDNLSTITTSMFFGCNQLQSIDLSRLPATVISPWAFRLCKALASVQLPPATATIGDQAFAYCENLTAISFPSTLKSIGNNAFDNNNLTSLQLNDGLETIGNYAFSGSKDLSASPVVIPQSVTSIGGSAFYNCDQMTSFTFPESLSTLDTYVLAGCDNLQTVVFPRNMTTIPRSTCEGCKKLANVTLPENVVTIGLQAFYGATSLPAITLPATVKTIEDNAFRDTNIPSLTLNEGLETIGASAFYNCDQLKTLNIPSTVKNIGNYAFYNCDSILTVTFPEDMTALTTIGTNLFAYNKQLTNVTLPKTGMSSIPNNMFQECDHLRNIQLPATITSIGDHAFYSCDSLQTIYIPDGVKSIGYETFCYCKGLRYVRLPEGLESIGQSCFAYTEKLPFINIPSTVTSMGNWAIHTTASSSNTNFKSIGIMGSTMPGTKDHVFWQYQPAFSLLVPAGQESDYQNSTSWTPDATDNRTIKGYPAEKQTLTQDLIHLSCLDKESYKSGSPEAVWIDWFEGMGNYRIWYTDAKGNKTATMPIEGGDYTISADFEEGPYYKPATFDNIATFSLKEIADEDFALLWDFYSKTYDRTKQKSTWTGSGGGGAPANWGLIEGVKESAVGIFGVKWNNGHVEEINFGTGTSIYNLNAEETSVSLFALPQVKKIEIAGCELYGNISDKVEAWLAAGKTLSPTLEYLDLQRNKLEGNISTLVGALPSLKTLDVHENRFSSLWPAFPETLENVNISTQTITDITAKLDLRDMTDEGFFSTLPSIVFYDPATRTYADDIKVNVQSQTNWSTFTLNYNGSNNFTVSGSCTWKGASGDIAKCSYTDAKNKTTTFNANFYYDMGDVDFNGLCNISDLQQSISYLFKESYSNYYRYNFSAGDMNADNAINVLDIVPHVDLLLNMNPSTTEGNPDGPNLARRAKVSSNAALTTTHEASLYIMNGKLILKTTRPVAAMDITISQVDNFTSSPSQGMTIAKKTMADRKLHIIIYSTSGKTLPTGETVIGTCSSDEAEVKAAMLVDEEAEEISTKLNNQTATPTGIESLTPVPSPRGEGSSNIYSLDGRKVTDASLPTGKLPKGVYIINGKKMVIK